MVTANEWAKSDDAVVVQIHINERGRGDGYDISIYQSKSTKRFLVEARHVATKQTTWWVCPSLKDATLAFRDGHVGYFGPGFRKRIKSFGHIKEAKSMKL